MESGEWRAESERERGEQRGVCYSPVLSKRADSSDSLYLVQYADVRPANIRILGFTELQVL